MASVCLKRTRQLSRFGKGLLKILHVEKEWGDPLGLMGGRAEYGSVRKRVRDKKF